MAVSCLFLVAAGMGTAALFDLAEQPGIGVLTLVLLGGISITAIGFHAVRIRAASSDRPDQIRLELVRQHLAITERLAQAGSTRRHGS